MNPHHHPYRPNRQGWSQPRNPGRGLGVLCGCLVTLLLQAEPPSNWQPLPDLKRPASNATAKGATSLAQASSSDVRPPLLAPPPPPEPKPVQTIVNAVEVKSDAPESTNAPTATAPAPAKTEPKPAEPSAEAPNETAPDAGASTSANAPSATGSTRAAETSDKAEKPKTAPDDALPAVRTPPDSKAQISAQVGGRTLYSFKAENLEIKSALALFARANKLNIVPDQEVSGQVTLDLENLPLDRVMQALLEAHDYSWSTEEGLIRVRARETREYWVDYLRLSRKGSGMSSAMLASGMSGGSGGGGGGGGAASGSSSVNLTADNTIDFWKELEAEVVKLLSNAGRESLAINMTAGVIQITDRPSALKRVTRYLESLSTTVSRQVEIQARIYDVTLKDQFQFGIDWEYAGGIAEKWFSGGITAVGSPTVTAPIGGVDVKNNALGLNIVDSGASGATKIFIKALQEQGAVNVVSQPRLRVVNNQTAMIKVGTETPFFTRRTSYVPGAATGTTSQLQEDTVSTITVGTILAITPQISTDEWVTLDIAPVLSSLVGTQVSPSQLTTAPVLDIKQASTVVRVRNGTTIIIGGLMQDERSSSIRKVPLIGDIPLLGKLFQGRVDAKAKKELVIAITPTIVN